MTTRSDGIETRSRLLQAALEIFARKGFHDATVTEICRHAEANVAAVNYHFGGKEQLYADVWKRAFEEANRQLPIDGGLPPSAPAGERLRALISAILSRILRHGAESQWGRLLIQEMSRPTEALHEIRWQTTQPIRERIRGIVRELLGPDATDVQVRHCAISVMHQLLALGFRGGKKPPALGGGRFSDEEIKALTDHIHKFSLGGIEAIAAEIRPRPMEAGRGTGS